MHFKFGAVKKEGVKGMRYVRNRSLLEVNEDFEHEHNI